MNHSRRTSTRTRLQLETLDERIAPAHLGLGALHAGIAQNRAALLARIEARVHSRAMHAQQMGQLNRAMSQVSAPVHVVTPTASAATTVSPRVGNAHAANAAHGAPVLTGASVTMRGSALRVTQPATTAIPVTSPTPAPSPAPTPSPNATQVASNLPANAGNILNTIYQEYQNFLSNPTGDFTSSWSSTVLIRGNNVGVDVHGNGSGDFNALVTELQKLGMQVTAADPVTQTVEGLVPIDQLATVAQASQTKSLSPVFLPVLS